jgi:hypothetical protein
LEYTKINEILEKLKLLHQEYEGELDVVINTMRNVEKAMGFCNVKE